MAGFVFSNLSLAGSTVVRHQLPNRPFGEPAPVPAELPVPAGDADPAAGGPLQAPQEPRTPRPPRGEEARRLRRFFFGAKRAGGVDQRWRSARLCWARRDSEFFLILGAMIEKALRQ